MRADAEDGFAARVGRTVSRRRLVRRGDKILVACSGGPDSTALLHVLTEIGGGLGLELAVFHFNHRLRAAADADEEFVRETARKLGLPFRAARRDVRAYATRPRGGRRRGSARPRSPSATRSTTRPRPCSCG